MKFAIGTNDKETLSNGHFGESHYFFVVNLMNAKRLTDECRVNAVAERHSTDKRLRILKELKDCDALIGRSFGHGALRNTRELQPKIILTGLDRIDRVVDALLSGSLDQFKQFDPGRRKFVPMEE
jgi:predicted Fe-Mo cluster-binding NifX family protein